jgi:hypothetical protein
MPISHRDLWRKIKSETKGKSPSEEIAILERYLSDWPEFKGPYQEMRKKYERRIEELRKVEHVLSSGARGHVDPFSVRKRGLGEVALIGLPNSGKTSVFRTLTGADAEVADYPYTTLKPNVGMFNLGGFEFEIVDLPAVPDDSIDTLSYATGLKEAVLNADLLGLVIDLTGDAESQLEVLSERLREIGAKAELSVGTVPGGRSPSVKGAIVFAAKRDVEGDGAVESVRSLLPEARVFGHPIDEQLLRGVGEALCLFLDRIVVVARDPDSRDEPMAFAVMTGSTVHDLAREIHGDLAGVAKRGKVWGASAKFPGQDVGLEHELAPGDIVEILTR